MGSSDKIVYLNKAAEQAQNNPLPIPDQIRQILEDKIKLHGDKPFIVRGISILFITDVGDGINRAFHMSDFTDKELDLMATAAQKLYAEIQKEKRNLRS